MPLAADESMFMQYYSNPAVVMKTRPTTRILSILFILTGLILLLESYGYANGIYRLWPTFPFILGTGFILLFLRDRSDITLLIIGTFLVCASILFFIFNFTTWRALADLWPLFIGFLGLSLLAPVLWGGKRGIFIPLALFLLLLCGAFILVFAVDTRLWPVSLILSGICMLLIGKYDPRERESDDAESADSSEIPSPNAQD